MSLCLAMLSWRAPHTLGSTLISYLNEGFLELADQRLIFLQERARNQTDWAEKCGFEILGAEQNTGIGPAFAALVQHCRCDHFLFLEDDWALIEEQDTVIKHLAAGLRLMESDPRSSLRLRHRRAYGEPLCSRQFQGKELQNLNHLAECIYWRKNPDMDFPLYISKTAVGDEIFYVSSSRVSSYTNNPMLYHTEFARREILPFCEGNLESCIQPWWETQDFPVFHGSGLFTHRRLDR